MKDPGLFPGLVVFLGLAWLGCLFLFVTQHSREEFRLQARLFFIAFALRFFVSIVIYQLGLVAIIGDDDSSGWASGARLQDEWQQQGVELVALPGLLSNAFNGYHQGYEYLLATLFYLTGMPYRLPAAALNGLFGALTVVFAYRIARQLFAPWVATRVGWWACCFPSMIIWSAQTVKEPVVIFLETVALYGCIRLQQRGFSPRHLALCIGTVVLLLTFRFYATFIVGVTILLPLLMRGVVQGRSALVTAGLVAILTSVVLGSGMLGRYGTKVESFDLKRIEQFRRDVSTSTGRFASSSGVRTDDVRTPGGLVRGTAVGAAHLLLAPFPWELGGSRPRMLLALLELPMWWWLFFVGVIPGLRYVFRYRLLDAIPLLLFLLGFGLVYSVMFGNVGLVFRQRAQLLPWLLIFAVVGLEQRLLRRMATAQRPVSAYALVEVPR